MSERLQQLRQLQRLQRLQFARRAGSGFRRIERKGLAAEAGGSVGLPVLTGTGFLAGGHPAAAVAVGQMGEVGHTAPVGRSASHS